MNVNVLFYEDVRFNAKKASKKLSALVHLHNALLV